MRTRSADEYGRVLAPAVCRPAASRLAVAQRDERGTVTAESAVVLPLVAAFALAMVWMVTVAIAQVQVVDAARDGARAMARGEDVPAAVSLAQRVSPGARVDVTQDRQTVTVVVQTDSIAPAWLLVPLPSVTLKAASTVEVEGVTDDG